MYEPGLSSLTVSSLIWFPPIWTRTPPRVAEHARSQKGIGEIGLGLNFSTRIRLRNLNESTKDYFVIWPLWR